VDAWNLERPWIYGVEVLPQFQGKGEGEKLMRAVLGYFRRKGFQAIGLTVSNANTRAIRLYKKVGFEFEMAGDSMSTMICQLQQEEKDVLEPETYQL